MTDPTIFVGLTSSFIQQRVQNGGVVDYLSDPQTAAVMTSKGETSLGLIKIKNHGTVKPDKPNTADYQGVIESFNDKTVHMVRADGTETVVKYSEISLSHYVESDTSYIVNFPVESEADDPTVHYFTESITWSPSLVLDFQTKIFSMAAVVRSIRRNNFTGNFTVVLASTKTTPLHTSKRAVMMQSSSTPEEIATTHPLIYKIGSMTISDTFRFPLKLSPVALVLRNFIEVSRWDGNIEGAAETGFLFDNPFYFPAGTLLIRQNHINTVSEIKSHQEHEPVIVKTYVSDKIRYRSFITDTVVEESSSGSTKKHQLKLRIFVDKTTDRPENVTIILNVGDLGEFEVEPKPTEGIQKPGKITWNVTATGSSEHFDATITYRA